jgi:hypothetical protein
MNRLPNSEGAAVERLGFVISFLSIEQNWQIIEFAGYTRVVWPINFLLNREGAAVERLGFIVFVLVLKQAG